MEKIEKLVNSLDDKLKELISKIDNKKVRDTLLGNDTELSKGQFSFSLFNKEYSIDTKSNIVCQLNFIKGLETYLKSGTDFYKYNDTEIKTTIKGVSFYTNKEIKLNIKLERCKVEKGTLEKIYIGEKFIGPDFHPLLYKEALEITKIFFVIKNIYDENIPIDIDNNTLSNRVGDLNKTLFYNDC